MDFFINQNATLPVLKVRIVKDGRSDYLRIVESLNLFSVYFTMIDVDTTIPKIVSAPCEIIETVLPDGSTEYYIHFKFRKRDTNTTGRYKGQFLVKNNDGALILPLREEIFINVQESFISDDSCCSTYQILPPPCPTCPVCTEFPVTPTPTPTITSTPTKTPPRTPTQTRTPTKTPTPTQTQTPTMTVTPTNTKTPTPTNTPTKTQTPTNTVTPTQTKTPTQTPTNTPTNTITPTETPTNTPSETPTQTPTETPTQTPTNTPTQTPTNTPTNTITPTETPTQTPSETPTNTPTNTITPTQTTTETPTNTPSQTPTNTITPTQTTTETPTNTPSQTPTNTITPTETPTNTPTQTPTNTITPTETPTSTPTPTQTFGCTDASYTINGDDIYTGTCVTDIISIEWFNNTGDGSFTGTSSVATTWSVQEIVGTLSITVIDDFTAVFVPTGTSGVDDVYLDCYEDFGFDVIWYFKIFSTPNNSSYCQQQFDYGLVPV